MLQDGMAGFVWPGADLGTAPMASASSVLKLSAAAPTATSTVSDGGVFFSSDVSASVTLTSTALDPGAFYSSHIPVSTSTATDEGAFFSSDVLTSATDPAVITSTALDPRVFYSSDVATSITTASDGGAFFSSVVSTSAIGSHTSTHCLPTAVHDNPLNPNVAPPIDAVPSCVDYGTLPTTVPNAAGLAVDRGPPFEISDLTALATNMPTGLSSTFTKRDIPRISTNPGPIVGAVVTALGVILLLYLSIKYCVRTSSGTKDLERGNYPYHKEVTRGRRCYRDGSPAATRPEDIPVSEGYGIDPIDLARVQNWQEGVSGKGVFVTRDRVDRAVGADDLQSILTSGGGNGRTYTSPHYPDPILTRKLVPRPRPVTQLPLLAYSAQCTDGGQVSPVSPLNVNDVQNDHNRTRDYSNVSPLNSLTMHRGPSGSL
jgi:hypothetical protein